MPDKPQTAWQPIQTAPKDGTVIRGKYGEIEFDCRFQDGEWELYPMAYTLGRARHVDDPTEWRPLLKEAAKPSPEDQAGFEVATSAELFAEFGSKDPEKDERELNAVLRRIDIKEDNK
jgi:hypothetical protein